jgi:hypothetical protein
MDLFLCTHRPSRELAVRMHQLRPSLPRAARVLFVGDTAPHSEAFLAFLVRMVYADPTLRVAVVPCEDCADAVFFFERGRLESGQPSCCRNRSSSATLHACAAAPTARCGSSPS